MKGAIIYSEWSDAISPLSLSERGELFTLILQYICKKDAVPQSPAVAAAWGFIKLSIDSNELKYNEICEKRRENGRRGGFATSKKNKQNVANVANATFATANVANATFAVAKVANTNTNTNTNNKTTPSYEGVVNAPAPAREEVFAYFLQNGGSEDSAERFYNYWEAEGWVRRSGRRLLAWQAAARQWMLDDNRRKLTKNSENNGNEKNARREIADPAEFTDKF